MKTTQLYNWATVALSTLMVAAAVTTRADEAASATNHEKSRTGKIASIDPAEHLVAVKGPFWSGKFHLGDACTYKLVDREAGTMADLRPGQKVTVHYQDVDGVRVANRITQQPMRLVGTVKALNAEKQVLTVRHGAAEKTFHLASGCSVVLRDEKTGTLANVQPGERVTVTYETPNGRATARQIAQTSATYSGKLTALDLSERTVKAKTLTSTKKFILADGCAIVVNGKLDGQMRNLAPGETLTISYDEINGFNVANRIAVASATGEALTAETGK